MRERWRYEGRGPTGPDGADCYRWVRCLAEPSPEGYLKFVYAHEVATFWPVGTAVEDQP